MADEGRNCQGPYNARPSPSTGKKSKPPAPGNLLMLYRLSLLSVKKRCSATLIILHEEVAVEVAACQWAVAMLATSPVEANTA